MSAANEYPRVYADDRGLWREDEPGKAHCIKWKQISRIDAYIRDEADGSPAVLEIALDGRRYFGLDSTMPGFDEVVEAISRAMPGIDPQFPQAIRDLDPNDDALTLWKRK